jgi:hypothetical protein
MFRLLQSAYRTGRFVDFQGDPYRSGSARQTKAKAHRSGSFYHSDELAERALEIQVSLEVSLKVSQMPHSVRDLRASAGNAVSRGQLG